MMKRWLGLALAIALLCGMATFAAAEQATTYGLGDRMDDFTVTLSDGAEVSLNGLLAEKKAVLLNFWASWCGPCKAEFPALTQAWEEMSDEIAVLALSCEANDTDEIILAFREKLGLGELPMGRDNGLAARMQVHAYPTSVIIDRNGVVCFREEGSIPDKDKFTRLFSLFTGDDYAEPVLVTEIPSAASTVEQPSAEATLAALAVADERIAVRLADDHATWPFVPAPDGVGLRAANDTVKGSSALLSLAVEAQSGEGLAFEYALDCLATFDSLSVRVDGTMVKYYGGKSDWTGDFVKFDTAGAHSVEIAFKCEAASSLAPSNAELRAVRLLTAEEVAALEAAVPVKPRTLSGVDCALEPVAGEYREIVVTQDMGNGEPAIADAAVIVQSDTLTMRVKIGADVDEQVAFIADNDQAVLLSNLPYDEEGFLYEVPIVGMADGAAYPYNTFIAYTSAVDMETAVTRRYTCFASEADADTYAAMIEEKAAAMGYANYEMRWEYADGSPKGAALAEETAASGPVQYEMLVTDEAGAPVAGVMLQICDETTCLVAVTDAEGRATHEAAPYPYEIHVLKAPEGYAPDATVYTLPEAGGQLSIVLKAQS